MKLIDEKFLKEANEAIERIARTPDGRVLYLYCQGRLMRGTTTTDAGALQRSEGERTFAFQLMRLMATGIAESGRADTRGTSGSPSGEQPIVIAAPKPVDLGRPGGAGRRITEHTRVPGYDPPDLDG